VAAAASALGAQNHAPTLGTSAHVAGLPAVTYSHSITLSGRETAGSRRVELQSNPFPFTHGFHTIVEVATGRSGKYAFVVTPTHATRYRVRIGTRGATSPPLTVYVLDREVVNSCNLCTAFAGPGTHTLKVREVFSPPPGTIAVKSPGYFYYGQVNGTRSPTAMTLRKSVPVEISHHKEALAVSYRVTFPRGPVQFAYQLCYRGCRGAGWLRPAGPPPLWGPGGRARRVPRVSGAAR
jgi:hypothetical protein